MRYGAPMPDPTVTVTHVGAVSIIQLSDPGRRNALSLATIASMRAAFAEAGAHAARAVILRAGPDDTVWCAGFDIGALTPGADPLEGGGRLMGLFRDIQEFPAPVLAMLHGTAWGGGADLALRCDIVVADPSFSLAFTPAKLGLPYDPDGLLNVLVRAGLGAAIEMFATAEPVGAERALRLGLVNHVVAEAELEAFTLAMAARIATLAPLSIQSAKQQLRALAAATALAPETLARLHEGRRRALESDDFKAGVAAFRARQTPVFEGR